MTYKKWQYSEPEEKSLQHSLVEALSNLEDRFSDIYPEFRNSSEVLVASDYAGEAQYSNYLIYSFLITDRNLSSNWEHETHRIRSTTLLQNRSMAYKKLSDGVKRHLLPEFIGIADHLYGVTITFSVDKRIKSLFGQSEEHGLTRSDFADIKHIDKKTRERFLRIVHFLSIICAGLLKEDQEVRWVSDQEEFFSNPDYEAPLMKLGAKIMQEYCHPSLAYATDDIPYNKQPNDDRILLVSDFTAIPDFIAALVAGTQPRVQDQGMEAITVVEKALQLYPPLKSHKNLKHVFISISPDHEGLDPNKPLLIGSLVLNP